MLAEGSYRELKVSGLDVSKLLGCSEDSVAAAAEPGAENDGASDAARDERASEECFRPVADRGETEPEGTNETRRFGKTPSSVYASYFSAGGSAASVFLFFSVCIFTQILTCGADYWIAFWYRFETRVRGGGLMTGRKFCAGSTWRNVTAPRRRTRFRRYRRPGKRA